MKQRIKFFLKKTRLYNLAVFLYRLYRYNYFFQLYAHYGPRGDGWIEFLNYRLYAYKCRIAEMPSSSEFKKQRKEFIDKNIVVIPNFLSLDEAKKIDAKLLENVEAKHLISKHDCLNRSLPKVRCHGKFPHDWFNNTNFVRNPLQSIPEIKEIIESKIFSFTNSIANSYLEIMRVFAYQTLNFNKKETHNNQSYWHRDGDVYDALKCIIYLNDVDKGNGPFTYRDAKTNDTIHVTGNAGTMILFRSRLLRHKASNTLNRDRRVLSFLLHPAKNNIIPDYDLRPDVVRSIKPTLSLPKEAYILE